MAQTKNNTYSRKEKHLSYSERCQIAVLKKEQYFNRRIVKILERASETLNNEIEKGTPYLVKAPKAE